MFLNRRPLFPPKKKQNRELEEKRMESRFIVRNKLKQGHLRKCLEKNMEDRGESLINDWELQRIDFRKEKDKSNCKFRSECVHRTTEKIKKRIIKENSSCRDSISLAL